MIQPESFYHIYNRGNNRQPIFYNRDNYLYFLRKVRIHLVKYVDIVAYCLMPNHFHFLVYTSYYEPDAIAIVPPLVVPPLKVVARLPSLSDSFRTMLSSYTRAINKQENRTGSLFQQNTKFKLIASSDEFRGDPFVCFHYIHQNPVKGGLVKKMEDWEMSSFQDYAGLRNGTLCNQAIANRLLEIPSGANEFMDQSYGVKVDL